MNEKLKRIRAFTAQLPELLLAAVVLFALALALFARVLLRPELMVMGSDFVQFYFWEGFTRLELAAGRLPAWNPYFLAGYPALANPQTQVFYPPAFGLRLLPLHYSFGVGLMLHVGWAGLGMYRVSRHQKLGRAASFVSAISLMLSGVVVTHIEGGHLEWVYTIAWLPWVLWAWQKVLSGFRLRAVWVAAVTTAMMFLGGGPRVLVGAAMMVMMMGLGWLVGVKQRLTWLEARCGIARLALGGVVLLGLIAPQLLPSLEFIALSTRSGGIPAACTEPFSLQVRDLAYFALARAPFESFLEWERNGYLGALAVVLALFGLVSRWPVAAEWKRLNIVWAVAGFVIGLGPTWPFFQVIYRLIPGLAFIRQPFTLLVLPCFAGAALAGGGMHTFIAGEGRRLSPFIFAGVIGSASVVADVSLMALHFPAATTARQIFDLAISLNAPRYLLALLTLAVLIHPARWRLAVPWALMVLALDLGLFAFRHIPLSPEYTLADRPSGMPVVDAARARIVTFPYMHSVSSMYTHTANAQGYAPIILDSYASFVRGNRPSPDCRALGYVDIDPADRQLLRLLSVEYIATVGQGAESLTDYYPRALWVARAHGVASPGEAIARARTDSYTPTQLIYLDTPGSVQTQLDSAPASQPARITSYLPQSIVIEVDAPAAGWVYLNDVWYPGWQATVNGEPAPVYRANGVFRSVFVPAGQSTVKLTYASTYLSAALVIGLVSWTATIGLLAGTFALRLKSSQFPGQKRQAFTR